MDRFILTPHKKRFFLSLLLVLGLAALFWGQSRYPALDEKALMSGAIQLEDPLSFEAKFPTAAEMPLLQRVAYSTLNWLYTNRQGMAFGILIAAAFLTLASTLRQHSFKNGFLNALLGLGIGAPMGVCVNCAAPIAKGLYSAGARAETTLAAMIASPTLNIVVLTMAFSILPFYMAATKLVLSLVLILIAVPLICRLLPPRQLEIAAPISGIPTARDWDLPEASESLGTALMAVLQLYLKNLWFIVRMTVPLMLLAGFLGALVATLLPGDLIVALSFGLPLLLLVALVGTFLPVPIAFDVVVVGALLSSGLETGYVMALLFTLGSFSVYSFFILAQSISLRAALLLAATVALTGVLAGGGAQMYHNWQTERALKILLGQAGKTSTPGFGLIGAAHAQEGGKITSEKGTVTVVATAHAPRSPAAAQPFSRLEASTIGIDKPIEFDFHDMWPPFWEGRSLASGDIDRDGDLDLVIASSEVGLYLYLNDGTGRFVRQPLDLGPLKNMPLFNAAFVDLDNDGWLDLFLTSYRQGNFRWFNGGTEPFFGQAQPPAAVKNRDDAVLTLALSFADVDRDGDLDAALGNWAAGWYRRVPGEESRNRLLINDGTMSGADFIDLAGLPGETLSILFSDISGDGWPDLLVGNDFEMPDSVYFGDGAGGLILLDRAAGLIPHTTTTTMAIKTADLGNRGVPDVYFAQIAGRSSGVSDTLKMQPLGRYCDAIEDPTAKATCAANMAIKKWYKSGNNFNPTYAKNCQTLPEPSQGQCKAMLIKDLAIQRDNPNICKLIPVAQPRARSFCDLHFLPIRPVSAAEATAALPQILRSNVLLTRPGFDAAFADQAAARGLDVGGWSWDTKVGDFDNDGDLDIYIVNGTWVPNEVSPSNLFFENDGAGNFAEASGPFGLKDYLMTAAATRFDMDGDGDLDLLTHPVNGPLMVFRNNDQERRSITVTLEDHLGNRDGIGAVIRLYSGVNGEYQQSRELQLGGGFMSFDAPVAHFGLGVADTAAGLNIRWPDGSTSHLPGPLAAGLHYRVVRRP